MLLGAVSSEKLFHTEKQDSVLVGRQSPSQELLPVLRYTVALWRPGGNWIWWTARMCLSASILLESCYLWSSAAETRRTGKVVSWKASPKSMGGGGRGNIGGTLPPSPQVVSGHFDKQVQGRTKPLKYHCPRNWALVDWKVIFKVN